MEQNFSKEAQSKTLNRDQPDRHRPKPTKRLCQIRYEPVQNRPIQPRKR